VHYLCCARLAKRLRQLRDHHRHARALAHSFVALVIHAGASEGWSASDQPRRGSTVFYSRLAVMLRLNRSYAVSHFLTGLTGFSGLEQAS